MIGWSCNLVVLSLSVIVKNAGFDEFEVAQQMTVT